MLKPKRKIYEDTIELAEALFKGNAFKASPDVEIEKIFNKLKEINEKEEEYNEYK